MRRIQITVPMEPMGTRDNWEPEANLNKNSHSVTSVQAWVTELSLVPMRRMGTAGGMRRIWTAVPIEPMGTRGKKAQSLFSSNLKKSLKYFSEGFDTHDKGKEVLTGERSLINLIE